MSSTAQTPGPYWRDAIAAAAFVGLTLLFWIYAAPYQRLAGDHPYPVGFVVFAILSTFGEILSRRLLAGRWGIDHPVQRAALWGLIGVWISATFPFQAGGVQTLVDAGLWPRISAAISISLWANILSGYGFAMMLAHYWLEKIVTGRWIAPWAIFADEAFVPWARIVLLSLVVFWFPAHSVTFMLPPSLRSLFAAYLGIALGAVLTIAKQRGTSAAG